ncbi:zinc transporter 2-like [Iris pallida]|uniref:Zinc transporter 2-like n=1 Tax=Iris pallida TaxID=29817 RepID=A0AAX6H2C0_IRIPA|nr:zinc transporter 2-like [Iris pallida]
MAKAFLVLLLAFLFIISVISAHGTDSDSDSDSDSGSATTTDLRSRPLVLVKIYCLVLVFVGTFAGGISPYFLKWNEGFLVLGTQFAGGVFLGTALMHFLSDADETFRDLTEAEYPFAFMLAAAGYVITMLADCLVSLVVARGKGHRPGSIQQENGSLNGDYAHSETKAEEGAHSHGQSVKSLVNDASSLGDSILLIVALCFHSVFEGIAIGVSENADDAWKALWTISLHKVFAAVAMGIALLRMMPDRPLLSCFAYAFAFAVSSPVGVAVGIVIDAATQGHVADWIFAISMGLACGIFVYVSINHLLSKGYMPTVPVAVDSPIYRWLSVVLGVGVIAVVMIWDT